MGQQEPRGQLTDRELIQMMAERGLIDRVTDSIFNDYLSSDNLIRQEVVPELQEIRNEIIKQNETLGVSDDGGSQSLATREFTFNGRRFQIPYVTGTDDTIKVANQTYVNGLYESVSDDLGPGENKTVARVDVPSNDLFLWKYTNATAHSTVRYEYYVDDTEEYDDDMTGTAPFATPPDLYAVSPDGFRAVDDFVELNMVETSGATTYNNIQGLLTGLLISKVEAV